MSEKSSLSDANDSDDDDPISKDSLIIADVSDNEENVLHEEIHPDEADPKVNSNNSPTIIEEKLAKFKEMRDSVNSELDKLQQLKANKNSTVKQMNLSPKNINTDMESPQSSSENHLKMLEKNQAVSKANDFKLEINNETNIAGLIRQEMMKMLPDLFLQFQQSLTGMQQQQEENMSVKPISNAFLNEQIKKDNSIISNQSKKDESSTRIETKRKESVTGSAIDNIPTHNVADVMTSESPAESTQSILSPKISLKSYKDHESSKNEISRFEEINKIVKPLNSDVFKSVASVGSINNQTNTSVVLPKPILDDAEEAPPIQSGKPIEAIGNFSTGPNRNVDETVNNLMTRIKKQHDNRRRRSLKHLQKSPYPTPCEILSMANSSKPHSSVANGNNKPFTSTAGNKNQLLVCTIASKSQATSTITTKSHSFLSRLVNKSKPVTSTVGSKNINVTSNSAFKSQSSTSMIISKESGTTNRPVTTTGTTNKPVSSSAGSKNQLSASIGGTTTTLQANQPLVNTTGNNGLLLNSVQHILPNGISAIPKIATFAAVPTSTTPITLPAIPVSSPIKSDSNRYCLPKPSPVPAGFLTSAPSLQPKSLDQSVKSTSIKKPFDRNAHWDLEFDKIICKITDNGKTYYKVMWHLSTWEIEEDLLKSAYSAKVNEFTTSSGMNDKSKNVVIANKEDNEFINKKRKEVAESLLSLRNANTVNHQENIVQEKPTDIDFVSTPFDSFDKVSDKDSTSPNQDSPIPDEDEDEYALKIQIEPYAEDSSIGLSSDDDIDISSAVSPKDIIQTIDNFEHEFLMLPSEKPKNVPKIVEQLAAESDDIPLNVKKYVKVNVSVLSTATDTPTSLKEFDLASTVLQKKKKKPKVLEELKDCEFCGTKLSVGDLTKHHRLYSKHVCLICGIRICNKKRLLKHMEEHLKAVHQCHSCFQNFPDQGTLSDHIETCVPKFKLLSKDKTTKKADNVLQKKKYFSCKICHKRFEEHYIFKRHKYQCKKQKSKAKLHQCMICRKEFMSEKTLLKHINLHKIIIEECLECGECFDENPEHALSHGCTGTPSFKFNKINSVKMTTIKLYKKIVKKHERKEMALSRNKPTLGCCKVCKSGFKKPSHFYDHMNYTNCPLLKYRKECPSCGVTMKDYENLQRHVITCFKNSIVSLLKPQVKGNSKENKLTQRVNGCNSCGVIFPNIFHYKLHRKTHHSRKQDTIQQSYHCLKCYFKCSSPRMLREHIKNNKCILKTAFNCFDCDEKRMLYPPFGSLANLLAHIKDSLEATEETQTLVEKLEPVCIRNDKGKEKLIVIDPKDIPLLENNLGLCEINNFGYYELELHGTLPNRFFTATKIIVNDNVEVRHDTENTVSFAPLSHNKEKERKDFIKSQQLRCFKCPNETFVSEKDITFHMRSLHKMRFVNLKKCLKCDLTFNNTENYNTHKKTCSLEKNNEKITPISVSDIDCQCGDCLAKSSATLKQQEKLKAACYCQICDIHFQCRLKHDIHQGLIHPSLKVFTCDLCDTPFLRKGALIKHYQNSHNLNKSELEKESLTTTSISSRCSICKTLMKDIRWHIRSHLNVLYECFYCNTKVSNKQLIMKHLKQKHLHDWTMDDEKWTLKLQREYAENVLSDMYSMRCEATHRITTALESKCTQCGMVFFHPKTLQRHTEKDFCTKNLISKTKSSKPQLSIPNGKTSTALMELKDATKNPAEKKVIVINKGDEVPSKKKDATKKVNVKETSASSLSANDQKHSFKKQTITKNKKSREKEKVKPKVTPQKTHVSKIKNNEDVFQSSPEISDISTSSPVPMELSTSVENAVKDQKTEEASSPVLLCGHCKKEFENESQIVEHIVEIERPSECTLCGAVFASKTQCVRHVQSMHCSTYTSFTNNFSCKSLESRANPIECPFCNLSFTDKPCYYKHVFSHFGICFETCHICDEKFPTMDCLADHIRYAHRAFFCKCCYKCFHSFEALHYHSQLHVIEVNIPRDSMGKMVIKIDSRPLNENSSVRLFPQFQYSPVFYVTQTVPKAIIEDNRLFFCHVCHKNIEGELTFIVHLKTHAEPRRLTCIVCSRRFEDAVQLNNHVSYHFSVKKCIQLDANDAIDESEPESESVTKCKICSQVFDDINELKLHEAGLTQPDFKKEHFHFTNIVRRYFLVHSKKPDSIERKTFRLDWGIAFDMGLEQILAYFSAIKTKLLHPSQLAMPSNTDVYTCQFCFTQLPYNDVENHLRLHVTNLTDVKTIRCHICRGIIPRNNVLEHMEVNHSKVHKYDEAVCQFCYIRVPRINLEGHMMKHQQNLPVYSPYIFCFFCNKLCSKSNLLTHMGKFCNKANISVKKASKSTKSITLKKATVAKKPVKVRKSDVKSSVSETTDQVVEAKENSVVEQGKKSIASDIQSPSKKKMKKYLQEKAKTKKTKPTKLDKLQEKQKSVKKESVPIKKKVSASTPKVKTKANKPSISESQSTPDVSKSLVKSQTKDTGEAIKNIDVSTNNVPPLSQSINIITNDVIPAIQNFGGVQLNTDLQLKINESKMLFDWLADCKQMICWLCDIQFKSLIQLKYHLFEHLNYRGSTDSEKMESGRYAVCLYCKNVTRTASMRNHINIKHKKEHKIAAEESLKKEESNILNPVNLVNTLTNGVFNASLPKKVKGYENIIVKESPQQDSTYNYYCHLCFRGYFQSSPYMLHLKKWHPHLVEAERQRIQLQGILKRAGTKRKNSTSTTEEPSAKSLLTSPGRKIVRPGNPPQSFKKESPADSLNTNGSVATIVPTGPLPRNELPKRDRTKFNAMVSLFKKKKRPSKPTPEKAATSDKRNVKSVEKVKRNLKLSDSEKDITKKNLYDEVADNSIASEIVEETEEEIIDSSSEEEISTRLSCAKCSAAFDDKVALNSHMNAAHPLEANKNFLPSPYVCLFCGSGHNLPSVLKKHIITKHPGLYTKDLELSSAFRGKTVVQDLPKRDRSKFNEVIMSLKPKTNKPVSGNQPKKPTPKKVSTVRLKVNGDISKTVAKQKKKATPKTKTNKKSIKATEESKFSAEELENETESDESDDDISENSSSESSESENSSDENESTDRSDNEETTESSVDDDEENVANDENNIVCKFCDAVLKTKSSLKKHEKFHFKGINKSSNELRCTCCDEMFPRHKLRWHMHQTHENDSSIILSQTKIYCDYCTYATKQKKHMHEHISACHPELLKVECKFCDEQFLLKDHFQQHYKNTHEKNIDTSSKLCFLCNKSFDSVDELLKHYSIVHMKKLEDYFCDICDKYFYTNNDMTNHNNKYHGDNLYTCFFCNAEFQTESLCLEHCATHETQTDYKCDHCDGFFASETFLAQHKIMSGSRCEKCKQLFAGGHALKEHQEKKACEECEGNVIAVFNCKLCKQSFPSIASLKAHMLFVHLGGQICTFMA